MGKLAHSVQHGIFLMTHAITILGCGYVGKAIAHHWQQAGFTITATTTRPERLPELKAVSDRAVVLRGDNAATLRDLLQDQHTLLVAVGAKGMDYKTTYLQTAQTLAYVLPKTSVQQVIYTSTYSVYGNQQGEWVDETMTLHPTAERTQILHHTEQTILQLPTARACVFRLGGIYGPGRELAKIYGRMAGQTRAGAGQEWANWIHLDDIVGAIAFAQAQGLSGIYNLVQDEIIPVRDLVQQVCDRHNLAPVQWDTSQPSTRPTNVRCKTQKLKAAGYTFTHPTFW